MLQILDTHINSAEENMRIDQQLLDSLTDQSNPILHLYEWQKKSITYGYFIKKEKFLQLKNLEKHQVDAARRPTGGGIVFHIWDFAFSFLLPKNHKKYSLNTLENYDFVQQAVLETIKSFLQRSVSLTKHDFSPSEESCKNFCMARPTKYDLLIEGKKIAGAAQRKTHKGFLHQGTIALVLPDKALLEELLLPNPSVLEAILSSTFPLFSTQESQVSTEESQEKIRLAKKEISRLLAKYLAEALL
jgi:lipoate-protein ligase A